MLEAIGTEDFYRFLLRDGDVKFGGYFVNRVMSAGLQHVVTAPGTCDEQAFDDSAES